MADVEEGAAWLAAREPAFAAALEETGLPPLRRRADGFGALLDAMVGQQISTAAAAAISARLVAAGATEAAGVRRLDDATLLGCGLSRPKLAHVRALAAADPDFAALRGLPDEGVVAALTALPGVGVWTAEVYAITCLGRRDVFAAGDLALREGARLLLGLPERPAERALRGLAAPWSPWRAVAARILWALYRRRTGRAGLG